MSALLLSLVIPAWAAEPPGGGGSDQSPPAATEPDGAAPDGSQATPDAPTDPDAGTAPDPKSDAPEADAPDGPSEDDANPDDDDAEDDDAEDDDAEDDDAEDDDAEDDDAEDDDAEDDDEVEEAEEGPGPDDAEDDEEPTREGLTTLTERVDRTMRGARRHRRVREEARRATSMRPYGQLQVFTTLWDQDEDIQADPASYGDPEADPGFQLARARFGFQGRLRMDEGQKSRLDYALQVGVNTPYDALIIGTRDVGMVDAFLRYSVRTGIGPTSLSLGLAKVPFSREALMSSADLVFMERAVGPASLTSIRDVGATATQTFVFVDDDTEAPQVIVSAGVYNGNADLLGDNDPGLMYAGRVELAKGDTYRTWNPDGDTAVGVGGSAIYNDALATRTVAWNADGLIRLGPWSLMGEFGRATLSPTDVTVGAPEVATDTTRTSWLAATSVFIGTGGEGGIEVAARVSGFDDNKRLKDNGDVLIIHGGAVWRDVLPFLDVGAGYIHREELQGAGISNDTIRIVTQIRPSR
jgi:hypothetical protein